MPHERVEAMPLQRTVPFRALQVRRDDENGERRRDEENVKRMKRMKRTYLASVYVVYNADTNPSYHGDTSVCVCRVS